MNTNALNQDESTRAFLKRRERELVHQISTLCGLLAPKQRELEEVRQAMDAIGLSHGNALTDLLPPTDKLGTALVEKFSIGQSQVEQMANALTPKLSDATLDDLNVLATGMTIKQMILRALADHFHHGATPAELREYLRNAFGRDIDRSSMGPQIARLRDDKLIEQPPGSLNEGKWRLVKPKTKLGNV